MKERPILFNAEMVRAVLDGRKTQTRRVVKFRDKINPGMVSDDDNWPLWYDDFSDLQRQDCPYGKPKNKLWVRENFKIIPAYTTGLQCYEPEYVIEYPGTGDRLGCDQGNLYRQYPNKAARNSKRTRPSIHMPRWASRITLTITDVRVERVQEISEGDAMAEGCFNDTDPYWRPTYGDPDSGGCPSFKNSFEFLWDSINQKRGYGWDKNPLVWVVEFEIKP